MVHQAAGVCLLFGLENSRYYRPLIASRNKDSSTRPDFHPLLVLLKINMEVYYAKNSRNPGAVGEEDIYTPA
ncbi:hypothetical protein Tph_c20120 [Thermacetogenium phaeum DSM 12270]|uniref:Uncharacterized protein n=1 Tax=Thermacetogenium phaeum (strain ATCC BAA-254 / DSM 26808 / PB) TaxID=1089553 RepID=K4LGS3_THEPS|nr:hypothetical protein [Thermacetogenium phaeum]AFV12206.1 hypothetical protein Tph_c20120 [Thermacetogenium phaeum DSM 12270]